MLNIEAHSEIRRIAEFLESCAFHGASAQLVPAESTTGFPVFSELQNALKGASDFHRFLFSVFRQGHRASEAAVRSFLPRDVFDALVETGLLVRDRWAELRTPDLALVSVQGLILAVSLPLYPTAEDRTQPVYHGPESLFLAASLPARLRGLDVLDVGCGSGLLALLCAARGARKVVGLELAPVAVNAARFNAILNSLDDIVEIRESDVYGALAADERFDFVVSSPPSMPTPSTGEGPLSVRGGVDGGLVVRSLLDGIGAHVKPEFRAVVACTAVGDAHQIFLNTGLKKFAVRDGYHVDAVVSHKRTVEQYKAETLERMLRSCCAAMTADERARLAGEWLAQVSARGAQWMYYQTLMFRRPTARPGVSHVPVYRAVGTDKLVSLVQLHRASA